MRRALVGAVLLLLLPSGADAAPVDPLEYETAIATIRCDCSCHPQSVKDCACGHAAGMREEIHAEMSVDPPLTAQQIIDDYVERKGEQTALIVPQPAGFNLLAWLGPLAGLVLACVGMTLLLWRLLRRRPSVAALPSGPALGDDDPYMKRLQRELEELE